MKNKIITTLCTFVFLTMVTVVYGQSFTGSWERMEGSTKITAIVTDGYFSTTHYEADAFVGTYGGAWEAMDNGQVKFTLEFNSLDASSVNDVVELSYTLEGDALIVDGVKWTRADDGTPGDLQGAWLMTGRKRDGTGEIQTRQMGPRKTMKILSGTRFQWIAYNTETGQFSGTGGGTYTTEDGVYTEHIEFFSRDNSRVGASLPFNYELVDGAWHHSGKSSKGDPIYEIWSSRSDLEKM